jgi:hypothetical protein
MTSLSRRAVLAAAFCAGLAAAASASARGHGPIGISDAWCPPTPPGAPTAAGYLTVTNTGRAPDRLTGASSPVAAQVQLHSMTTRGGVMRMRPVTGGLEVGPGRTLPIQPGGELHLMLIGLKRPLKAGDHVPVTLTFARAGSVGVEFAVHPQGAAAPATHLGPHDHMARGGH